MNHNATQNLIYITCNGTTINKCEFSIIKYKIRKYIIEYLNNCKLDKRLTIINNIIEFEPNFYKNLKYDELISGVAQNLTEYLIDADRDKINKINYKINYNFNNDEYFSGWVADCFYSLITSGHF